MIRSIRTVLWVVRIVFRFLSGRPMSGQRKTDSTFLRPATRSLDPSGSALRWEMMRGASRAAWRVGVAYVVLLSFLLPILWLTEKVSSPPWWMTSSFILWSHLSLIGGALSSYGARRVIREHGAFLPTLQRREDGALRPALRRVEGRRVWRTEKVLPVARSLSVIAGHSIPERSAEKWVYVPKDYRDGGTVTIFLPPHFTGADANVQKRLVSSVSARLGVPGMSPSWLTEGSLPRLLLTAPPIPPEKVEYVDVKEWLLSSKEYRPLLGLTGGGKPFYAEMIEDSPHVALSAGPGAGKSTMAKTVVAQALHWGWGVIVLDWKQSSAFSWLGGLEGVTYLSHIDDIHDMGVRLAEEVDLRKQNGMAGKAKVLVVRDEWNATAPLLADYWSALRSTADAEEKKAMPLRSPALSGYAVLDFAGREYGLFDFCIAQRFSARIFNGNADIRECFQIKLMARYSPQTVKMLAPDIKPFPRKSNHVGRWVAVVGDEATVVQGAFLTSAEARELASSGQENPKFPLGSQLSQPEGSHRTQEDQLRRVATPGQPISSDVNSLLKGLKLSELAEIWGVSLPGLRKIVEREDFPSPIAGDQFSGYRYDQKNVTEWWRNRAAVAAAEKGK